VIDLVEKKIDYPYKESGLEYVVLVGVTVQECPQCGERMVLIPRIEELHRLVAERIVSKKARLTGDEIQFLRKQLGWTVEFFSDLMGASSSMLSSWENGAAADGSFDRLIRSIYVVAARLDFHLDVLSRISTVVVPVELRLSAGRNWADAV
jgi:putative zinc finger/helix-turn-helix YgiT family protein